MFHTTGWSASCCSRHPRSWKFRSPSQSIETVGRAESSKWCEPVHVVTHPSVLPTAG